ncbi:hypothetical protein C5167_024558 [Papaver somniferum]|uniref:DUF3615 domain-containing protein n=1 Tax=Papaver somniferum TaxID=3469 RepID=A0A4Y7JS60_PAPSO|nr:hypothetical protein C5167_024558 [Papaver somniferum]
MVVLRSSSKGLCGSSSSNSYSLRSKDVSDPSLDGSKRLCSRVGRIGPKAKAKLKEFEFTSKKPRERKYTSKDGDDVLTPLAIEAMRFYNKENADVPDAPEEMFFAELTATNKDVFVEVCKCMGPKNLISGEKINGCSFCNMYDNVQHPKDGGFTAGDFFDFEEWKKNYDSPRLIDGCSSGCVAIARESSQSRPMLQPSKSY